MLESAKFVKLVTIALVVTWHLVLESTKTKLVKLSVRAVQLAINALLQLSHNVVKWTTVPLEIWFQFNVQTDTTQPQWLGKVVQFAFSVLLVTSAPVQWLPYQATVPVELQVWLSVLRVPTVSLEPTVLALPVLQGTIVHRERHLKFRVPQAMLV